PIAICGATADRVHVDRLAKRLSAFRVPKRLVGRETDSGPVPAFLGPFHPFLFDREGGCTAADRDALDRAHGLVVVCSPHAVTSEPLDEALRRVQRRRGARVLCLIVSGEPNAADKPETSARECFPRALRFEIDDTGAYTETRVEPIAADLRPEGDGRRGALLKLAAGLLQVRYDDLRQRDLLRRQARMRRIATGAFVLLVGAAALTVVALRSRDRAREQRTLAIDATEEAQRQEGRALAGEAKSRRGLYDAYVRRGWQEHDRGDDAACLLWQVEALRLLDEAPTPDADDEAKRYDQRVRIGHLLRSRRLLPEAAYPFEGDTTHAALDPTGRTALVMTGRRLHVFDAETGDRRFEPIEHASDLTWAVIDARGERIAAAEHDGRAHVYDVRTGGRTAGPLVHEGRVSHLLFHPDGSLLYTACADGRWRAWRLDAAGEEAFAVAHEDVFGLAVSADGRRFAATGLFSNARVWDARTGDALTDVLPSAGAEVVRLDPSGRHLLVLSRKRTWAELWDVDEQALRFNLLHDFTVHEAGFSPDGSWIATVGEDEVLWIWETSSGERVAGPFRMGAGVTTLAFSPDGSRIAAGAKDGTVRVWDVTTGHAVSRFLPHDGEIQDVALGPGGERVFASGTRTAARLWSLRDRDGGALRIADPEGAIRYAVLLPGGGRLLTLNEHGVVGRWDVETGRSVREWNELEGPSPVGLLAGPGGSWAL
ncbi:MAG: WD40 repeat domain-containing protein, partial [Planctomycetota bacterium]